MLKRFVSAVFVLIGASFLAYAMMLLAPGDAPREIAVARYGGQSMVDQATIDWIIKTEKLDRPLYEQYCRWLKHAVRLDFGNSLVDEIPVRDLTASRFDRTLDLALAAILVALVISVPLGILSGLRRGSWVDSLGVTFAATGVSMPNYWLGLVLIVIFCVKLQWLPSFGRGDWHHLILPAITLGTALTAYTTRILRSAVIDTLRSEHIMALYARGLDSPMVIGTHVLKNALIPVITVVGLEFGMILEGAVITETVFAWPGLGELLVSAVGNRDYPLIQGLVVFTAALFVGINMIVDIVYRYLDPRMK